MNSCGRLVDTVFEIKQKGDVTAYVKVSVSANKVKARIIDEARYNSEIDSGMVYGEISVYNTGMTVYL
jgi:hypothetical protein